MKKFVLLIYIILLDKENDNLSGIINESRK